VTKLTMYTCHSSLQRVGDILYITSQVTAIFETSLEVNISVFGETPSEGKVSRRTNVVGGLQGDWLTVAGLRGLCMSGVSNDAGDQLRARRCGCHGLEG